MTQARMPGRRAPSPLQVVAPAPTWSPSPPRCLLAEAISDSEREFLAQLGVFDSPPCLRLVTSTQVPAPHQTPAADLRRALRRERIGDGLMWAVLLASVVFAAIGVVTRLAEVAP